MPIIIGSGSSNYQTSPANDPTTRTALDLVTAALRKIGQYAPGEAIDGADANDALDTLNAMFDQWSIQNLSVFNQVETVVNLTAGQSSYTIGAGQFFNTERPLNLVRAYSRLTTTASTLDFPCEIITLEKYTGIGLKTMPGPWPKMVYYNSGFPNGTLYMWPVPTSNIEFHLWSDQIFSSLALTDTVSLPRGYYLGLQYSLAELLCSEYGMAVPPDIKRFAKDFRDLIKDQNAQPQTEANIDPAIITTGGNDAGWILHGGFR